MSMLHDVALNCGVKRTNTSKMFWGMYAYSLKTAINPKYSEDRREATHAFWKKVKAGQKWSEVRPTLATINQTYKKKVSAMISKIIEKSKDVLPASGDYYYLPSDSNVTFYFRKAEDAEKIISINPKLFHTYSAPASDAVEKRLREIAGRKVEVRQQGFYREFPYRITFKWETEYQALDQRVLALQFEDSLYSQGDRRTLYVKSEDDFFLAKLGLSDRIDSVSECLTVEEVEKQSA